MTEMDKLEQYLIQHRIEHNRYRETTDLVSWDGIKRAEIQTRDQICVPEEGDRCKWDAICQHGSYGYKEGLLEICGDLVDPKEDGDTVVGWQTADDVIRRLEGR